MYQEDCVPVTHDTIEGAVKWLWDLDRLASVSNTACVEAVLRACEDKQVCIGLILEQGKHLVIILFLHKIIPVKK